jgi:hypothetical protein
MNKSYSSSRWKIKNGRAFAGPYLLRISFLLTSIWDLFKIFQSTI